jgi:hypothetical protein
MLPGKMTEAVILFLLCAVEIGAFLALMIAVRKK